MLGQLTMKKELTLRSNLAVVSEYLYDENGSLLREKGGINTDDLEPDLIYVPDDPGHGTIQPAKPMSLKDYQNALASTNINWEKV